MTDDTFFERLRDDAQHLQYRPDDITVARLSARVRARLGAQPTVAQMLAGWLRPLAAVVAAIALAATLSVTWEMHAHENNPTVDQIATNTHAEISVGGVTLGGE